MAEIAEPVPVAELIARRRRGRYHALQGHLSRAEVAQAWPVVWRFDAVIEANEVRTITTSATGTYGTTEWTEYNAEDVQRVAAAIAAGAAVLESEWRRDTTEGRRLQALAWQEDHRQRQRRRAVQVTLLLLATLAIFVWVAVATAG